MQWKKGLRSKTAAADRPSRSARSLKRGCLARRHCSRAGRFDYNFRQLHVTFDLAKAGAIFCTSSTLRNAMGDVTGSMPGRLGRPSAIVEGNAGIPQVNLAQRLLSAVIGR
jgi:hypothetical protein